MSAYCFVSQRFRLHLIVDMRLFCFRMLRRLFICFSITSTFCVLFSFRLTSRCLCVCVCICVCAYVVLYVSMRSLQEAPLPRFPLLSCHRCAPSSSVCFFLSNCALQSILSLTHTECEAKLSEGSEPFDTNCAKTRSYRARKANTFFNVISEIH